MSADEFSGSLMLLSRFSLTDKYIFIGYKINLFVFIYLGQNTVWYIVLVNP